MFWRRLGSDLIKGGWVNLAIWFAEESTHFIPPARCTAGGIQRGSATAKTLSKKSEFSNSLSILENSNNLVSMSDDQALLVSPFGGSRGWNHIKHPEKNRSLFRGTGGLLLTLLFQFLLPASIAYSCGPMREVSYGYSFFDARNFVDVKSYPQLLGQFSGMLNRYTWSQEIQTNENIDEWSGRFCDNSTKEDIKELVYKSSISSLEELRTAAKSKSIPVPAVLNNNSFAKQLAGSKCVETIDYLIFAKRCEPYVVKEHYWTENSREPALMYDLIEEGKKRFKKTDSHFIRLRYAYQLIRLAHYAKDYPLTLNLYELLLPKVDVRVKSILHYWILGHKAGALQSIGKRIEASIIFADIFEHCPSKREQAFLSFDIKTNKEWETAINECDSDSLRATFHAMRAYNDQSRAVEELEKIYGYSPDHSLLKLLTVREIKKLESRFFGEAFKTKGKIQRDYLKMNKRDGEDYLNRFEALVSKIATENRAKEKDFWLLCRGYLKLLKNKQEEAKKDFEKVATITKDSKVKEQLEKFNLQLRIMNWRVLDDDLANDAFEQLAELKDDPNAIALSEFLIHKMSNLYKINDRPGAAFLCEYPPNKFYANPKKEMLDDLIAMAEKKSKNRFERMLVEPNGNSILNELYDLKAMKYLREGKVAAALEWYKKIPRNQWAKFGKFNSFEERINECVNCPLKYSTELLTKGELIEKMLSIEYESRAKIEDNAVYLYQLGLAYFNMSYFGHSWQITDRFRSGSNWYYRNVDRVFTTWMFPNGNHENHDLSKALIYFEQARANARNPELAAKAAYMAARCEQNFYFTMPSKPPTRPREYFQILKEKYSKTKFYDNLVKECKYFKFYVSK